LKRQRHVFLDVSVVRQKLLQAVSHFLRKSGGFNRLNKAALLRLDNVYTNRHELSQIVQIEIADDAHVNAAATRHNRRR
jgi:hypothetical protein